MGVNVTGCPDGHVDGSIAGDLLGDFEGMRVVGPFVATGFNVGELDGTFDDGLVVGKCVVVSSSVSGFVNWNQETDHPRERIIELNKIDVHMMCDSFIVIESSNVFKYSTLFMKS